MLLFGIGLITLGAVLPDLRIKHSLDAVQAGTLFSILPAGIIGGSLLFGPVCDRYGYRMLLPLSALLMFAGFEGLAFTDTVWILTLSVFLIGLGGGAINGATNAVVADISTNGKGADLSILGVFFGIGALGMPLLLSLLKETVTFETTVAGTGILTLGAAVLFIAVRFPEAKQAEGISMKQIVSLGRDPSLLLIAFFLFFQSAFEGLINNWTTTYLIDRVAAPQEAALMGLSSYVAGMTVMRLLIGSVMRKLPERTLLFMSFAITLAALLIFSLSRTVLPAAQDCSSWEQVSRRAFPHAGSGGLQVSTPFRHCLQFRLVIALWGIYWLTIRWVLLPKTTE
jgi:MFS family permease